MTDENQTVNDNGIIDFDSLPRPQVIETSNYDTILTEMVEIFQSKAPEYAELLESDPILKVLETYAYRELLIRSRINDAVMANMLPFATDADLDMLGAFYGVKRNITQEEDLTVNPPKEEIKEVDSSFRSRIRDRIAGWSTAGGAYHYRYWARAGISNVHDVSVESPKGGLVRIAVMSIDNDGIPSDELIAEVQAQVMREDVKVLTDTIDVVKASPVTIDVQAEVVLRNETSTRVYEELVSNFATSFNTLRLLGRDVTRSWLVDQLFAEGVYNINLISPTDDVELNADQFPALSSLNISLVGRKD